MSSEVQNEIRFKTPATVARYLFAIFLVATGLMTMGFGINGYPIPEEPVRFADFMRAMEGTGYIIFWVGFIKFIAGSLLFVRRTTPLGLLIALPYTANVLLYCIFIAPQYLMLGIPDFLCNVFLIVAWFDWYRGCFQDRRLR